MYMYTYYFLNYENYRADNSLIPTLGDFPQIRESDNAFCNLSIS
jgi:hypothetical protein